LSLTDLILNYITKNENVIGYAVLVVSSLTEYIFPPFPGDTVTLFGAFLIAARQWSFVAVFCSVTAGSVIGASIDYLIGKKFGEKSDKTETPELFRKGSTVLTEDRYKYIKDKFDKYGAYVIILNRFMPGIRAFFFVVAGMTGMKFFAVQFFNLVSVILWNLLIIWTGFLVGDNWDGLLNIFSLYSKIFGIILLLLAISLLTAFYVKKNKIKE